MRKIKIILFFGLVLVFCLLVINYYRYDLFAKQAIKVDRKIRLLEMGNLLFNPLFISGEIIDYYNKSSNIIKGKTIYENRKIVKRIRYYRNGNTMFEIPFLDCSIHGINLHYFKNGQIRFSEEYLYGFRHGKGFEYFQNGNIDKEINFNNGKKCGDFFDYDSVGNTINHIRFDNNKILK